MIVETVQGEGGINVARPEWLRGLADLCQRHGILLIVDDVQMGCGRTGPFFSFEAAGITPDIVCLSKSIGGYGLPLALTLIRPDLDIWEPGEHNGTFRGVNPALVTGTAALRAYWRTTRWSARTRPRASGSSPRSPRWPGPSRAPRSQPRGRGLARGLAFEDGELAAKVSAAAFERGLLVETAGPQGEVVKLLPPLTITDDELDQGLRAARRRRPLGLLTGDPGACRGTCRPRDRRRAAADQWLGWRAGLGRGPRSPRHQASATMHQVPSGCRRTMLEPSPLSRTRSLAGPMPAISRSPSTSARSPEASTAWTVADSGSRSAIRSAMVSRRPLPLRPAPTSQGRRIAPRSYWASTASRSPSLSAAATSSTVSSGLARHRRRDRVEHRRCTSVQDLACRWLSPAARVAPAAGPAPRLAVASGGLAFLWGKHGGQARRRSAQRWPSSRWYSAVVSADGGTPTWSASSSTSSE